MLREMQKLLAEERAQKEQLELQVQQFSNSCMDITTDQLVLASCIINVLSGDRKFSALMQDLTKSVSETYHNKNYLMYSQPYSYSVRQICERKWYWTVGGGGWISQKSSMSCLHICWLVNSSLLLKSWQHIMWTNGSLVCFGFVHLFTMTDFIAPQLEEARRTLQDQDSTSGISEQYEKKIQQLSEELNKVRRCLQQAELKASEPSSFVVDLQKEMATLKVGTRCFVEKLQKMCCCRFLPFTRTWRLDSGGWVGFCCASVFLLSLRNAFVCLICLWILVGALWLWGLQDLLQHITVVVSISQTFDVSSSVLLSPLSSSSLTTTSSPCHHYCYHLHPPLLNFIMTMTTIIPLQSLLFGHKTHAMLMSAYRYTLTLSVHSPSSLQASTCMSTFTLFGHNRSSALMLAYLNTLSLLATVPALCRCHPILELFLTTVPALRWFQPVLEPCLTTVPALCWCQPVLGTLYTDVSVYLNSFWPVSALHWCQPVLKLFTLMSANTWTLYTDVSLYLNSLHWCQPVLELFTLMSAYTWTVYSDVRLHLNSLPWCQPILELFTLMSANTWSLSEHSPSI